MASWSVPTPRAVATAASTSAASWEEIRGAEPSEATGTTMRLAPNWRIWALIWAGTARQTAARQNRVAEPTAEDRTAARARERRRRMAAASMRTNRRRLVVPRGVREVVVGVVSLMSVTSGAGP